ncbi:bile acid-sensitive ion channel [Gastrophryne carolinensis]
MAAPVESLADKVAGSFIAARSCPIESLQRQKYMNLSAHGSGDALYGTNQFSDMTPKEFSSIFLKSYPGLKENYIVPNVTYLEDDSLPLRFDWRDKNMVTQVKNQMDCGACWAFSIVDTVESVYAIKGHPLTELSVQQVIDCSYMDNGCNGGSTLGALKWLYQSQAKLVRSSDYPFKARTGLCHYVPRTQYGVSINGYKAYDMSDCEEVMTKLLIEYGPLAIIVNALSWQDYLGGIIQHHCSSGHSNHAVVIVGYDKSGDTPYWIVKNSWSTSWGIEGYVHIKMGDNLCGIADFVTFPLMFLSMDVVPGELDLKHCMPSNLSMPQLGLVSPFWQQYWGLQEYAAKPGTGGRCSRHRSLWSKIDSFIRRHSAPSPEERKKYTHDFAVSTSFHGVHNLVHNNKSGRSGQIRRGIWFAIVLIFVLTAISQVYLRIFNYFTWPTTTSVTVQYVDKIEFPSVTFCNLNRFQTNAVNNLSIAFLMWNIVSTVLHFSNTQKDSEALHEMVDFLQRNQNFSIKDFTRNYGFYLNNSTLLKCNFFGIPCSPEDFHHVFTEYGNCYTFNHRTVSHKRVSTSGKGLSVLFDIKQSKFTDDPSLGFVDAGITFVLHSPKIPPRFDGLGLQSPVGMHAHASIRQFKTVIQEYPWGECNPNLRLAHHEVYSTYGCIQECKSQYIQDKCGCVPFLLPGVGKECDLFQFYKCVYPTLYSIDKLGLCSMGTYNSSCPVPCEEIDYPTTLSYATFPSDRAADFLSSKLNKDATYMRNNLVYIDIKYHELNYKISKQQKAMTSSELLSDVGGQLGLFCGASMITMIEILEFVFTNFFWLCAILLLKVPTVAQLINGQSRYNQDIQEP